MRVVSFRVVNEVSRYGIEFGRMGYVNRYGKSNLENEFIIEFYVIFRSFLEFLGNIFF